MRNQAYWLNTQLSSDLVLDNKAEFIKKVKLVISNHNKRPIMALETGRTIILFSFLPAAVTYGQR